VLGDGGPPAYFLLRVMICLTLFALWRFTGLVHAFTAPIGYLFWLYVVYRSRDVAAKDELVGLHPRRRGW
jgi:nitrate reductase gamma subunit